MSTKPLGGGLPTGSQGNTNSAATGPGSALDHLGDLPRSYGTDSIFLVAQEPHWLFTYWDIDIALHPGGKTFLRVLGENDEAEVEIEVPFETRNWYIPVAKAASTYTVEIGYYRGNAWKPLARSISVQTPPDSLSTSDEFQYATIPLHLSFQRLMENIRTTLDDGESLLLALARLQKEGKLLAFDPSTGAPQTPDEQRVLEALLGSHFLEKLSSESLSSGELADRIRQRLEERLSSAGASELSLRGDWSAAESSLFSALTAVAGQTSWTSAALSSWAAAALTSWAAAAQSSWGPGAQTSWQTAAPSSWTAESLSSWLQSVQSSWGEKGALSSGESAQLTSWLQAATSSWAGAALSSWTQAALTSWTQGAMTSWGHAETSSWGGSETMPSAAPREFFMHVNAEVIFYGGTHPQAKVTIDGQPVRLNPDGTFRHHFIFPDGKYEIPIVAVSPDGVETRQAALRFERSTTRVGEVGSTAQPPLGAPMGAKL